MAIRKFFKELPYVNRCSQIIEALVQEIDTKQRYDIGYAASSFLYSALPEIMHCKPIQDDDERYHTYCGQKTERYFSDSIQLLFWLDHIKNASDSDGSFSAYFNLAYMFYKASHYKSGLYGTFCSLETADFGRAFELGLIDENELLFELCGRPASKEHLNHVTNKILHQYKKAEKYPGLMETAKKAINRIVELESSRGEMTTVVSHLASRVQLCYGIDTFVSILLRMGKDSYVRGYNFVGDDSTMKSMLSHLLKCCYPNPEDNSEALARLLTGRKISDAKLVDAAMYAPQWMDIIEGYLGWDGLKSAAWYFHAHMNDFFPNEKQTIVARFSSIAPEDFKDGAFDVAWFWDAYRTLGEARFKVVYNSAKYVATGAQHRRAQLFSDAVTEKLDRNEIEKTILIKRNKDQLLAYALIPIADKSDLLHRYELIQTYLKQAKTFGAQRQASETTAGRIALSNLARNAGYADVNRLTWRMETEKLEEVSALLNAQVVDGVSLRLNIDPSGEANLDISKDGKRLKDIPAVLRRHELVVRLKTVQKELRQQRSRARASLENMMASEDSFEFEELLILRKNPVIAPLIENLVLIANDCHGFLTDSGLIAFDGAITVLTNDSTVSIAHPHTLFHLDVWAQYQRNLFERKIVQPFKQVFRELYVPNADELKLLTQSNRYAGHQVQPKKTLALLRSRGWTASYEEGLQKVCFKDNLVVTLHAQADWFSPADIEAPTLEGIVFHERKTYKPAQMDQISPMLFSEIMRDIDLVVSVAHAGGVDPETSLSTVEMRLAIIAETIRLMHIENVELRNPFAFIKGALGEYIVHLGSGTVQKMAAGSLYIIPVHSQHRGRIFLPFVDDDPRTAEVVSKIILLAEDKKIKDPEILRQMQR